ncbi:unnamed protein product, partial [Heterosigma akashiwo]
VFVQDLPPDTNAQEISFAFANCGKVQQVRLFNLSGSRIRTQDRQGT